MHGIIKQNMEYLYLPLFASTDKILSRKLTLKSILNRLSSKSCKGYTKAYKKASKDIKYKVFCIFIY